MQSVAYIRIVEINKCQNKNDLDIVPEGATSAADDAGGGDGVAQEVQLCYSEHALLQVEGQAVGSEDGEQCTEVRPVPLSGFAEDPVIIFYDHQCCLVEAEPHFPNLIWAGFSFSCWIMTYIIVSFLEK